MLVFVGFQAFRPASSSVSWDTEVSTKSSTFHTRGRYEQFEQRLKTVKVNHFMVKRTKRTEKVLKTNAINGRRS